MTVIESPLLGVKQLPFFLLWPALWSNDWDRNPVGYDTHGVMERPRVHLMWLAWAAQDLESGKEWKGGEKTRVSVGHWLPQIQAFDCVWVFWQLIALSGALATMKRWRHALCLISWFLWKLRFCKHYVSGGASLAWTLHSQIHLDDLGTDSTHHSLEQYQPFGGESSHDFLRNWAAFVKIAWRRGIAETGCIRKPDNVSFVFCYVIHTWILKYLGLRCLSVVLTYSSTLGCHEKWKIHTKLCRSFSHQWIYTTRMKYAGGPVRMTARPEGLKDMFWLKSFNDGRVQSIKTYSIHILTWSCQSHLYNDSFSRPVTNFSFFFGGWPIPTEAVCWGIIVLRTALRTDQRRPRTHVGLLEAAWLRQATWFQSKP